MIQRFDRANNIPAGIFSGNLPKKNGSIGIIQNQRDFSAGEYKIISGNIINCEKFWGNLKDRGSIMGPRGSSKIEIGAPSDPLEARRMSLNERPEISRFARTSGSSDRGGDADGGKFGGLVQQHDRKFLCMCPTWGRSLREYFKDENKNAFVPGAERVPPISEFSTRLFLRSSMAAFMKGMCDGTEIHLKE